MTRLERLLARVLAPRSTCSACGRPWFSDKRQPCRCGTTARTFTTTVTDRVAADDRID